jgi:TorA maturation chaperone TorD
MSEPVLSATGLPHPLAPEDQARADYYALLSRLYADAPDAALLQAIAQSGAATESGGLEVGATAEPFTRAWARLGAASAAMDAAAAAEEYQELFIGVGQSAVSLHASAYLPAPGKNVLVEVRATLAQLGLGRLGGVSLYEDHLAAVCETMRVLIAGAPGVQPFAVAEQGEFFGMYLGPWVFACCTAIKECTIANYYRRVAEFTASFMAIERDSLAIE